MKQREFDVLALTTPYPIDSSIAIAACRAGYRGVLDLEWAPPDGDSAIAALDQFARFAHAPLAIKTGPDQTGFADRISNAVLHDIDTIVLAAGSVNTATRVREWRNRCPQIGRAHV